MKRCLACGNRVGESQRLCTTCRTGLTKYPDENPVMVNAYVELGLNEMGDYLERWRLFDLYLSERRPK